MFADLSDEVVNETNISEKTAIAAEAKSQSTKTSTKWY